MLTGPKQGKRTRRPARAHRREGSPKCTSGFETCIQRRQLCAALSSHGELRCKREHDYEVAQVTIDYTFGHDEIAQTKYDGEPGVVTGETHIFGHGSVRVLYDLVTTAATIAQAFTFAAFGQSLSVHGTTGVIDPVGSLTALGYSGEYYDANLGMQYLRARTYDSSTGRFNRLDPFAGNIQDPLTLHKYVYVHNDPIQGVDPSGLLATGTARGFSATTTTATIVATGSRVLPAAIIGGSALAVPILGLVSVYILEYLRRVPTRPRTRPDRKSPCRTFFPWHVGPGAISHIYREPIDGNRTVSEALVHLKAGRPISPGEYTYERPGVTAWARSIGDGTFTEDAGHVIARQLGGLAAFNYDQGANIFPQDPWKNRTKMRTIENRIKRLHSYGCDICMLVHLSYASNADTRPNEVVIITMIKRPGETDYRPALPEVITN